MIRIPVEGLSSRMSEFVKTAPKERVLLTRGGKPFAIVSDASMYDEEDIGYMTDPAFWAMIAERRKEKGGIPLEKVEARIAAEERRLARQKREKNASNTAPSRRQRTIK
jgi:hypothetical protein